MTKHPTFTLVLYVGADPTPLTLHTFPALRDALARYQAHVQRRVRHGRTLVIYATRVNTGRYRWVLTADGCYRKDLTTDLTTDMPTMPIARRTFRELVHRHGFRPEDLALMDMNTTRYISHAIALRGRY